jgi:dolichol-phosphate mannosyltransferase
MELTTPGWAETIIIVLVLGGIQMIMLGITGEYIWRNLEESRKRPFFIVEDSINIKR